MAKLAAKVTISGLKFTRDVIKRIVEETEFQDGISEDFKAGFYSFGEAAVNMLENMMKKGEENVESGP